MQRIIQAVKKAFHRRKITERSPRDFKTHKASYQGGIMSIATKDVVCVAKSSTIKAAAGVMAENGIRRLPVVDPGTRKLVGILSASDILDFLGGGEKYNLFSANKAAFLNHSVEKIMEEKVVTLSDQSSIGDALKLFKEGDVGGAPVLDGNGRLVGIVSERDLVMLMSDKVTGRKVKDNMSKKVITATHGMSIDDAARVMLRNGFRRLPVTRGELLHGFVSAMDLVRAVASNKVFDESLKVEDIMATEVITTTPDADLGEVAANMSKHEYGAFPVVEGQRLVGMITERDLLEAIE